MAQQRTKVFVSYSHQDTEWLNRLQVHLKPLVRDSSIDLWDDTKIMAGDPWHQAIEQALAQAKLAILLITADFLASDYIGRYELPRLLEASRADGATILPVIVGASRFLRDEQLSVFQTVNDPKQPLDGLPRSEQESVLERVSERVEQVIGHQELRERVSDMRGQVEQQQRQIDAQQALINQLVTYMLSSSNFRHISGIALLREYKYWDGPMNRELYFLRDIGFIRPRNGDFPIFDAGLNGRNLSELLEPTPIGWSCIRLRRGDIPPEWASDRVMRLNLRENVAAEIGM